MQELHVWVILMQADSFNDSNKDGFEFVALNGWRSENDASEALTVHFHWLEFWQPDVAVSRLTCSDTVSVFYYMHEVL